MPSSLRGLLALGLLTPVLLAAVPVALRGLQGGPEARSVPTPTPPAAASTAPPGAWLLLAPDVLDLGVLAPDHERTHEVAWRSLAPRDLRVLGARSGCGCVAWAKLPTGLEAGGVGTLGVHLRAPTLPGPIDVWLRLVVDAPAPHDVVGVRIRAFVGERLVVRPAALDLGRRTLGSRVPVRLEVHLPPGVVGPVEAELGAWPGTLQVVAPARHAQHGSDVLLESALTGSPGLREGVLHVRASGAGAVSVPLRVRLEPPRPETGTR